MKKMWRSFAASLAVMLVSGAVWAQVETGLIAGTVTDPSGAVVTDVTVTVTNLATNAVRTTQSTSTGAYEVTGLEPATYQVTINSSSFKPYSGKVEVTVGGHVTLDPKLSVTQSVTEVQVVGEGGVAVNTQTQELSQVVDTQQMANLPSLTRNAYDFVAVGGNVSSGDNTTNSSNSGQNLTSRGVGFSLNGQRESGTEILMDGVENVGVFDAGVGEQIPLDGVQEYSVITNNFTAQYGRASGGVVNLTTKSGTNSLHGSAWEFNRLSAYTANTYTNDAQGIPKGIYTRNQFGYAAGAPILKDKLFIFESTEWTRVRSQAIETAETLDPAFISMLPANTQAYFSTYGTGVEPTSSTVTAAQLATASSPLIVNNVNGVTPVPGSTPIFDVINFKTPFDAGGDVPQNQYQLVGRLDYNLSDKTQMFFRGARQNQNQFSGSAFYSEYPQYNVGYTEINQSYLYALNHTFGQSIYNSAKVSYTRFNDANSFNTAYTNTPNLMIVSPTDPVTQNTIRLPGLENYGEPGEGGLPYGGPQNTIQPQDDLTWTKGKHSMQFGGQMTYIQLNVAYGAYAQAVEELGASIQNSFDDLVNAGGNPGGSGLVDFAARVNPQGQLPCYTDVYGNPINPSSCLVTPPLQSATYARSYRYKDWAFYAQDSWKVTPRLTLNYGLRYEHYGVQHNNKPGLDSNFYYGAGSTLEEQTRNGGVQIADKSSIGQFWAPRWGTPAPRVGFAYDVMGDGKSSLRGGYGLSYERNFGNVTFNASFNPPASAVLNTVCAPATANCPATVTNNDLGPLGVAGTSTSLPPLELRMPQPNIQVAQTQFWSLALDRQLSPNMVLELAYSGAHGVHLYDIENINLAGAGQAYLGDPLVTGSACANTGFANEATGNPECLTRPTSQYSNINMRGSLGSSEYEAVNVKLQAQDLLHSGVSFIANYTYSHSLDDISSTFSDSLQGGSGDVGSLGYTDLNNPGLDWGSSDYDVRNRLAVAPIWTTPWFKTGHSIAAEAAGGWSLSGIFTVRTGIPFNVYDLSNVENFYTIPRLTPATPITQYKVPSSPSNQGGGVFNAQNVPAPAILTPLNSELGVSDFGPFPANMTSRNAFRGPGAWNFDLAASKHFKITERVGMEFRAEGFDIFNHHNFYVNTTNLYYDYSALDPTTGLAANPAPPAPTPLTVTELKGGLGSLATGGNHDERRFGQFALRATF